MDVGCRQHREWKWEEGEEGGGSALARSDAGGVGGKSKRSENGWTVTGGQDRDAIAQRERSKVGKRGG